MKNLVENEQKEQNVNWDGRNEEVRMKDERFKHKEEESNKMEVQSVQEKLCFFLN